MANAVYLGTSGMVLPFKNKSFYPEAFENKSRLAVYGMLNNSIEINSSFYKIPKKSTVEKWNESVPHDFKFTFKLFREITHTKGMSFDPANLSQFMQTVSGINPEKRACILMQFPASYKIHQKLALVDLLQAIQPEVKRQKWRLAVEFRDRSWFCEEIYELMDRLGFSLVIHDKKGNATPLFQANAAFVYVRFHGPEGDYRGTYDDLFLSEYTGYIQEWLDQGKDVFIYFNNTMGGALHNLEILRQYLLHSPA